MSSLVKKDSPELYDKLTDLNFPFVNFGIEISESLFVEYLHSDALFRLWNLIFFEGANAKKKNAQQIIMSAAYALIKINSKVIMSSSSAEEIDWHLKMSGNTNFDTTDFINIVLEIRGKNFVSEFATQGILGKIQGFFGTDMSLEGSYGTIVNNISKDFKYIGDSNLQYENWLINLINSITEAGKNIDFDKLNEFFDNWKIDLMENDEGEPDKNYWLTYPVTDEVMYIFSKPGPKKLSIGV